MAIYSNVTFVHAQEQPQFGIRPANASSGENSKSYITLTTQAGNNLKDAVIVSNPGTTPVKLKLYPVDASTNQTSGAYYSEDKAPKKNVGSWIILENQQIELAPSQQTTINITLTIPKDAKAGQHLGGIAVQEVDTDSNTNPVTPVSKQNSFTVKTVSRTVMSVLVNVGDVPAPSLKINGAQVDPASTATPVLTLLLQNDGGSLIKPKGEVVVTDKAGTTMFSKTLSLNSLIPETSINYPVQAELPKIPGTYKVHASLEFGGTAPAVYDGQVEIKAQPVNAATTAPATQASANQPVTVNANTANANTADANVNSGNTASNPAATTAANPVASSPVAPATSDNSGMMLGIVIGVAVMLGLTTLGLGGFILATRGKKGK